MVEFEKDWKKLDKKIEYPPGYKVFCPFCKQEAMRVPRGLAICMNKECDQKIVGRYGPPKGKVPSRKKDSIGRFLPTPEVVRNNNGVSPLLLREEEVTVLINFLTSVPLSGFNNGNHNILVRLLRRLRRYKGEVEV